VAHRRIQFISPCVVHRLQFSIVPFDEFKVNVLKLLVFIEECSGLDVLEDQLTHSLKIEIYIGLVRVNLGRVLLVDSDKHLGLATLLQLLRLAV